MLCTCKKKKWVYDEESFFDLRGKKSHLYHKYDLISIKYLNPASWLTQIL